MLLITTNLDLEILALSCFHSSILPTSFAPFLASSSVRFILAMLSWKINLFNSSSPIFAEAIPPWYCSTSVSYFGDIDCCAFVLTTNMSLWIARATAIIAISASSVLYIPCCLSVFHSASVVLAFMHDIDATSC